MSFNVEQCIKIHNALVQHIHTNPARREDDRYQLNWFSVYGEEAEAVRHKLTPDLCKFLEGILVPVNESGSKLALAPLIESISTPYQLFVEPEMRLFESFGDFVSLYRVGIYTKNDFGIVMCLETGLCVVCMTWDDERQTSQIGYWLDLECILMKYVELHREGKFILSDAGDIFRGVIMQPLPASHVDQTSESLQHLINVISERLPNAVPEERPLPTEAELSHLPPVLRGVLGKVHLPTFKYIAPGLRVSRIDEMATVTFDKWTTGCPVFRFDRILTDPTIDKKDWVERHLENIETGLWLHMSEDWGDTCRLVLPYRLGSGKATDANGIALKQDFAGLFQHGYCLYGLMHRTRLAIVLEQWAHMIEAGVWSVDADGVEGTVDTFREADQESTAASYVLKQYCWEFAKPDESSEEDSDPGDEDSHK